MNRESKIFMIAHLYPVYIVCHLQWGNSERISTAIFNIAPIFFVCLLLSILSETTHIRLCRNEKRSIAFFNYFFVLIHIYYAICALIYQTAAGKVWILSHNAYIIYFIIFMVLFYFTYRVKQQRD